MGYLIETIIRVKSFGTGKEVWRRTYSQETTDEPTARKQAIVKGITDYAKHAKLEMPKTIDDNWIKESGMTVSTSVKQKTSAPVAQPSLF